MENSRKGVRCPCRMWPELEGCRHTLMDRQNLLVIISSNETWICTICCISPFSCCRSYSPEISCITLCEWKFSPLSNYTSSCLFTPQLSSFFLFYWQLLFVFQMSQPTQTVLMTCLILIMIFEPRTSWLTVTMKESIVQCGLLQSCLEL